jgi:serine/threonine-protein kinase HipA
MVMIGKRQNITRDDLLAVAKSMNIKKADAIIAQVNTVISRWNDFAAKTDVSPDLRDAIDKTLLLL